MALDQSRWMLGVILAVAASCSSHPTAQAFAEVAPVLREIASQTENQEFNEVHRLTRRVRFDRQGRFQVLVYCNPLNGKDISEDLERHGFTVELQQDYRSMYVYQGWLPPMSLYAVASLPAVRRIAPPDYPEDKQSD